MYVVRGSLVYKRQENSRLSVVALFGTPIGTNTNIDLEGEILQ